MAKLEITGITGVFEDEDRSVSIIANDPVRGQVTIKLNESDARWLRADLSDKARRWAKVDGEDLGD